MGYRRMTFEDLSGIFRRWHDGQKQSHIAEYESKDRKTIRLFISKFMKNGFFPGCELPDKIELDKFLISLLPVNKRKSVKQDELLRYENEIRDLLCESKENLDMLHAWKVIQAKYDYKGSYETFKIFVNKHGIFVKQYNETIRIDMPPGREIQIDYGKVGTLFDRMTNRNRTVYAFCGILSYSRLPFIRFVYGQDSGSFVECNIRMLEFYGGCTDFISLDNLKSGVIKTDLYDPKLNKAYEEMAAHYGIFINPCRVRKPKDKGKIERFIRPARQLFVMLKNIHPLADIIELNKHALVWCTDDYGIKEHGTTHIPPITAFERYEKMKLKKLPETRFEIPVWKNPTVGRDQFIDFEGKYYGLPAKYKGSKVWVKRVNSLVSIYYEHELIRKYIVPVKGRAKCDDDFPEVKREMMNDGYVSYLLDQAGKYGESAFKLIEKVLSPHAFLNMRKAQGILQVFEKHSSSKNFSEVCAQAIGKNISDPRRLKMLFKDDEKQIELPFHEISETGKAMIRDIQSYFENNHPVEDDKIN